MSIIIDPTLPANAENIGGGLGASRIRNLAGWLQQMFGGAGTAPVTYNIAPFITDTTTGLSTVPGNPTAAVGIATKQYVDQGTSRLANSVGGDAYTLANTVPLTSLQNGTQQYVLWQATNTTIAPTLNVDGLGPIAIVDAGGNAPAIGELQASQLDLLIYNSFLGKFQTTGMRIAGDISGGYRLPQVSGFKGQALSAAGSASGQVYQFNGTGWVPTIPAPSQAYLNVSTLANTSITGGGSATLYTFATNAPNLPGNWRAHIGFAANFSPTVNGSNGILTIVLTSNQTNFIAAVGNAVGGFNSVSAHTVSVSSSLFTNVLLAQNAAVTLTVTGYASQASVTLSQNPDAGSGGGASFGGIAVTWIQGA